MQAAAEVNDVELTPLEPTLSGRPVSQGLAAGLHRGVHIGLAGKFLPDEIAVADGDEITEQ